MISAFHYLSSSSYSSSSTACDIGLSQRVTCDMAGRRVGTGVSVRPTGPATAPCVHCGSGAVAQGVCASCGRHQPKRAAPCVHRKWAVVSEGNPYPGRQLLRCTSCGLIREVETA